MPVVVVESNEELVQLVADYIREKIQQTLEAITQEQYVTVALSGGSMPSIVCPALRQLRLDGSIWPRCRFVFTDERLVPFDDSDSTYGVYDAALFGAQSVPGLTRHSFLPIQPHLQAPECALDYEKRVSAVCRKNDNGQPAIDVVLLGLGPDGHTGSLFPDHPLLECDKDVSYVLDSPKPPPTRVTLCLPMINRARHVAFIATGSGKAPVMKQIMEQPDCALPAARVRPPSGDITWFVDDSAIHDVQLPQ